MTSFDASLLFAFLRDFSFSFFDLLALTNFLFFHSFWFIFFLLDSQIFKEILGLLGKFVFLSFECFVLLFELFCSLFGDEVVLISFFDGFIVFAGHQQTCKLLI